jgi:hypothetical protein
MDVCCEVVYKDQGSSRVFKWDSGKASVPNEQSTHATSGVGPSGLTAEQSHAHVSDDASSSPEHSKSDDKLLPLRGSQTCQSMFMSTTQ